MNRQKILLASAAVLNTLAPLSPEEAEDVLKSVKETLASLISTKHCEEVVQKDFRFVLLSPEFLEQNNCLSEAKYAWRTETQGTISEANAAFEKGVFPANFRRWDGESRLEHRNRLINFALVVNAKFRLCSAACRNFNLCNVSDE